MADFGHDLKGMRAAVTERTRMIFVASPNNPTGMANAEADLIELAESLPTHVIFCLDEAYAEYLETVPDLRAQIAAGRKLVCLRTFSKIYGLGGLRVGYAYGDPELIELLHRVRQPFNVNVVAQAAATAALADQDFVDQCRVANAVGRTQLVDGMEAMGYPTLGGSANFVLSNVGDGRALYEALLRQGVIVRPLAPYGMARHVRITIGSESENRRLLAAARQASESSGGLS